MSKTQILEELSELAPAERLVVIEAALEQLRKDLQQEEQWLSRADRKRQLTSAVEALFSDYVADGELRLFTALDG